MLQIEIDNGSGFCFGVTTAIQKAEEELAKGNKLYCLGDIVHNGMECERLRQMGLITINHADMELLHDVKVLLRAHGEPPETYELARRNHIEIIDATCPVVLQLQRKIKRQHEAGNGQIVIFGKKGHAEVLGLVGQTQSTAIVIESFEEVRKLDFSRDIYLYSQTSRPKPRLRVSTPFAVMWQTECRTFPILQRNTTSFFSSAVGRAVTGACCSTSVCVSIRIPI